MQTGEDEAPDGQNNEEGMGKRGTLSGGSIVRTWEATACGGRREQSPPGPQVPAWAARGMLLFSVRVMEGGTGVMQKEERVYAEAGGVLLCSA